MAVFEKVGRWCKETWAKHKEKIIVGGIMAGSFALGYAVNENGKPKFQSLPDRYEVAELPSVRNYQLIDEDIFTSLAPEIEDLVLEKGADEGLIDRTYEVEFPKKGSYSNGSYKVLKNVQVLVRDAGDVKDEVE